MTRVRVSLLDYFHDTNVIIFPVVNRSPRHSQPDGPDLAAGFGPSPQHLLSIPRPGIIPSQQDSESNMEMQWNNENRVHSEIIPFPSGGRFCFLSISCIIFLPLMYYWRSYAFNRLILSNEFCNKSTHIYMYIEKSKNPKIFYHTNAP